MGGAAAGAFVTGALCDLFMGRKKEYEYAAIVGILTAFPLIALGGLILGLHLKKPEAALNVFIMMGTFHNFNSWMAVGAWAATFFAGASVACAMCWSFGWARNVRYIIEAIGLPLAILVALYTGLLLSGSGYLNLAASKGADGHPLWSRSHLPLMFLTSGLSAGIAITGFNMLWIYKLFGNKGIVRLLSLPRTIFQKIPGLSALLRPSKTEEDLRGLTWEEVVKVVRVLSLAVVVAIAFEAFDIYVYLNHLSSGNPGTQLAHKMLTTGPLSTFFWGGVIMLGLAIPLLITPLETIFKAHAVRLQYVKFCSILIGGLIFRYVIVINGALSKAPLKFPGIPPSGPPIF